MSREGTAGPPGEPADPGARVRAYHEGTKHHFNRFARSLGYLDWAAQPRPFRSFAGTDRVPLFPAPAAEPLLSAPDPSYDELFAPATATIPVDLASIGFVLRHALGLSAWKEFRASRWSLRVNPSSGNLHPTEAYVVTENRLWHYAPDVHALEERCRFSGDAWTAWLGTDIDPSQAALIVLTSIHWREAWKYGERAFRYCQHDIGHAIAAVRLAAAMCGWHATMRDEWTCADLCGVAGLDRDGDYLDAEREEPACALLLSPVAYAPAHSPTARDRLVAAVRAGDWSGRASQLSEDHVQWTFIDDVAAASRVLVPAVADGLLATRAAQAERTAPLRQPVPMPRPAAMPSRSTRATALVLQRRSAVAFDARTAMPREQFLALLARVMPSAHAPWDVLSWAPAIHLVLFVHRVDGLDPGIYLLPRSPAGEALLRAAIVRDFSWTPVAGELPLFALATGDCRRLAQRLSCDQDIAADGCFSAGMLADFAGRLDAGGASFYRRLFWESGVVGQVLYLEAEAAGLRGTGIGCFYDDAVHEVLGLQDDAVQSLYHFTVGGPVDDTRLTTEPGYDWESATAAR